MKKISLLIIIGTALLLFGCNTRLLPQTENNKNTTTDESQKAATTLTTFFDYLNKNEFDKAVSLTDPNDTSFWDAVKIYAQDAKDMPGILKNYCTATQTCLQANVTKITPGANGEYKLAVQFLNKDGTTYIFGPCCGATEEEMPSVSTFDFTVKKINGIFKVTTPPLYRP